MAEDTSTTAAVTVSDQGAATSVEAAKDGLTKMAATLAESPAPAPKPLDLSSLDLRPGADLGAELELLHPVTGAPLGMFLTVLGADSPVFRGNQRRVRDAVAAAVQAEPKDEESIVLLRLSRAAACAVTGWRTGDAKTIRFNGMDVEYSYDQALAVMLKLLWVVDQVTAFRDTRANFFKP